MSDKLGMSYNEVIGIANQVSDNVGHYATSLENIYKKLEEARNLWKGVDNNAFTNKVIANKGELTKIGNAVESHAEFLRNIAVKTNNLQNDIAEAAKRLGMEDKYG